MTKNTSGNGTITFLLMLFGVCIGALFLLMIQGVSGFWDKYHGEPGNYLSPGTYQILAVAEKSDDSVLLVLRDIDKPGSEARFHRIRAVDTLNFDSRCLRTGQLVVKVDDDVTYIKFLCRLVHEQDD